jgi:hypothetical protein
MRRLKLQDARIHRRHGREAILSTGMEEVKQYSIANAANPDYVLLGHKTATSFIPHWKSVTANPKDPDFEIGRLITNIPKVVFSELFGNQNGRMRLLRMARAPTV